MDHCEGARAFDVTCHCAGVRDLRLCFKKIGLKNWQKILGTNDKGLLQKIAQVEKLTATASGNSSHENSCQTEPFTKVLGVNLDSESDDLFYDLGSVLELAESLKPTKRSLLKIAAKIFDPLGGFSIYTIKLKVLFQEFCLNKLGWDEELKGADKERYEKFVSEIKDLNGIHMPRCLFERGTKVTRVEIHAFSDASASAYGCFVYLRAIYETGEVSVRFIASKAKVCPIKKQSIPRLELMAAHLLAKLVNNIKVTLSEELGDTPIAQFYWVDSLTTLCWIRNDKVWKQFVRHRVSDILSYSHREELFYCPGKDNPADLSSRGTNGCDLSQTFVWWEGPSFLNLPSMEWPSQQESSSNAINDSIALQEKVKLEPNVTHVLSGMKGSNIENVICFETFSTQGKLLRVFAWVQRFVSNLKATLNHQKVNKENQLTAPEISNSEVTLIHFIQSEAFKKEIEYLRSTRVSKPPIYVTQFNLFVDDKGILRCISRIKNSTAEESGKEPILLPNKHNYSRLIVESCHSKVLHYGIRETLNLVRQKYWILRAREWVKGVIRKCIVCKKLEGFPFQTVFSTDLPKMRVDDKPPFTNTGLDFAGPLIVSNKFDASIEEKRYILGY